MTHLFPGETGWGRFRARRGFTRFSTLADERDPISSIDGQN